MALLGKMAHDCLVSIRTVPGCIGVDEAIEGLAVASFDGVKPSLLDRKAQAGMIESNQGTNAGEIKCVGQMGYLRHRLPWQQPGLHRTGSRPSRLPRK